MTPTVRYSQLREDGEFISAARTWFRSMSDEIPLGMLNMSFDNWEVNPPPRFVAKVCRVHLRYCEECSAYSFQGQEANRTHHAVRDMMNGDKSIEIPCLSCDEPTVAQEIEIAAIWDVEDEEIVDGCDGDHTIYVAHWDTTKPEGIRWRSFDFWENEDDRGIVRAIDDKNARRDIDYDSVFPFDGSSNGYFLDRTLQKWAEQAGFSYAEYYSNESKYNGAGYTLYSEGDFAKLYALVMEHWQETVPYAGAQVIPSTDERPDLEIFVSNCTKEASP